MRPGIEEESNKFLLGTEEQVKLGRKEILNEVFTTKEKRQEPAAVR